MTFDKEDIIGLKMMVLNCTDAELKNYEEAYEAIGKCLEHRRSLKILREKKNEPAYEFYTPNYEEKRHK